METPVISTKAKIASDKIELINDILNLLEGLSENERVTISRDLKVRLAKVNGKKGIIEKPSVKRYFSIPTKTYTAIGSTSMAISPAVAGIKNFPGFGVEEAKAKKKFTKKEKALDLSEGFKVALVNQAIENDPDNSIIRRVETTYSSYKVFEASNGWQKWVEIEKSINNDMIVKSGLVAYVDLGEGLEKLSRPSGSFKGRDLS